MRPVFLELAGIQVHSYYVLWTFALCLAVILTRRRMTGLYSVPDDNARVIIALSFTGMLVGARAGSAVEFWEMYSAEPWRLLRFWKVDFPPFPPFWAPVLPEWQRHGSWGSRCGQPLTAQQYPRRLR